MRILGLDPGEKRIGVALSDPLAITAQGLCVLSFKGLDQAVEEIGNLCREHGVEEIVIGNPLHMNGSPGSGSEKALKLAGRLRKRLSIKVTLIDERLTSDAADRAMIAGGLSRKKRRKIIDKLAAVMILETYLARRTREETASFDG